MTNDSVEDHSFDELTLLQFHDLLRLRVDVFVVEQGCPYPELDGRDTEPSTRHVWIPDAESRPRGYLRVLGHDGGSRIGRVAVRPESRSEGLGSRLVTHAIERHPGPWVVHAQAHLQDWYEGMGFVVTGPEYMDAGISHLPMKRESP